MKKTNLINVLVILLLVSIILSNTYVVVIAESLKETIMSDSQVISSTLNELMEADSSGNFDVMITLEDIDTTDAVDAATSAIPNYEERKEYLLDKKHKTEEEANEWDSYTQVKRTAMKNCYQTYTSNFTQQYLLANEEIYSSAYLPVIIAHLSCTRIEYIAENNAVVSIDYYCDEIEETNDVDSISLMAETREYYSIRSNIQYVKADVLSTKLNTRGAGINIGILDSGIPNTGETRFEEYEIVKHYEVAPQDYSEHAENVLEIIANIAPEANYFCTTFNNISSQNPPTLIGEMNWLIGNNVDVINISLTLESKQNGTVDAYNEYGAISKLLDMIIYLYGITIVTTSGNNEIDGSYDSETINDGVSSGGMSYNAITVGNYDRSSNAIDYSSSYNQLSQTHYKPDICAPGSFIFPETEDDSGTSYAAPLVTGVVALLMAYDNSFTVYPEQVKSVLTAAVSLSNHHYVPADSNYRMYGAGILDAERAGEIAISGSYSNDIMYLSSNYNNLSVYFVANQKVRISLTFLKAIINNQTGINIDNDFDVDTDASIYSISDLDLIIFNPGETIECSSSTYYNNVEIVEFTPSVSGTYTIQVRDYSDSSSGDSSETEGFIDAFYSIAWIQRQ